MNFFLGGGGGGAGVMKSWYFNISVYADKNFAYILDLITPWIWYGISMMIVVAYFFLAIWFTSYVEHNI